MIKRILVTLSANKFTNSAIEHGLELAKLHDAKLVAVTDINAEAVARVGPVPLGGGGAAAELAKEREKEIRERIDGVISDFSRACKKASVKYEIHQEEGEPFDRLHELWRYTDLVVAGLRGLFAYDVIQSPQDVLVRMIGSGVQPVLAVAQEYRPIKNALIAYNGSPESAKAMKRFVQMRMWPDLQLRIVTFDMPSEEGEPLLTEAADYCRAHGYEPITGLKDVNPRKGILQEATSARADILVMGATARSRIARSLLGDTVLEAVKKSEIPLFLAQ